MMNICNNCRSKGSFFILTLIVCLSACQEEVINSDVVQIFAPDRISSNLPEFATTINEGKDEVYFNRTSDDRSTIFIMHSKKKRNKWSRPMPVSFSNGTFRDVDPFLTADGKRLYFSSDRPLEEGYKRGVFNTWYVEMTKNGWSNPINPGLPLNTDYTEIYVTMAKNGNAYFVSERNGERMILKCRNNNGNYLRSERVDLELNGYIIYASNPCISNDEQFIIVAAKDPFSSDSENIDLFISVNLEGTWSVLQNLGPKINSPYADFAPGLSKDDKTLYFSSERPGIVEEVAEGVRPPSDIYYVNIEPFLKENGIVD